MANFLFNFFNKNRRMVIALSAFLTPIVGCTLFALLQGEWLGNFYLPASQWNDELLYYKQVEGVVGYGFPQGFFGYNESTASSLTFSAWSPVIMGIYVLWGKIFGWSYSAPIICNILLICIGLAFFVYKAKLDYKQMGLLAGFVVLFVPLSRFMLSCMADCEIVAILMIYMGFYMELTNGRDKLPVGSMIGLIVCSIFLTLMRPYFLLLFLIPGFYWFKKKKIGAIVVALVALISMVAYAYITGMFTAAYFYPLINTEWIKTIMYSPLGGIKNAILLFIAGLGNIFEQCLNGIIQGNMEGGLWCIFVFLLILIVCLSIKDKKYRVWAFIMIALLGAVVMFYDIRVGSRHLIPFIVPVVLLLCSSNYKKIGLSILALVLILFTSRIWVDEYNYKFPAYEQNSAETIEELQEKLAQEIVIEEAEDFWDNTVIWLFYDETMIAWQNLYALPSGVGINLCMPDYVVGYKDELKAKYIAVNTGESIDLLFAKTQAKKIVEQDGFTIYKLRE